MEKKLTAQGPKDRHSYTVTLPKEWIKRQKLDKTRKVELKKIGNKIIIFPLREVQETNIINADDYDMSLIKVIPALYREGINNLRVNIKNTKLLEEIINIIRDRLIGYEIIEQKKEHIIIKDITKESKEDFNTILRRTFLLLLELSKTTDKIQVECIDKNIKRLTNYSQRILIKKGHEEFQKIPQYYLLLNQLEKIDDELTWLLSHKMTKNEKEILKEINKNLREAYETFYKFNPKNFNNFNSESYKMKNKLRLGERITHAEMHLHNLCRLINSIAGTIFIIKS